MLMLWSQAVTPGLTHFGAHHRPPDSHFCRSHCHNRHPLLWALWLSSTKNEGQANFNFLWVSTARNEEQPNLNDQFQLSSGSSKPEMREGDEGRQQTSKRRQTFLSKYHIDHFHYHFHDAHAVLTNICFRYMSRLRTGVDSVGDSGIEMTPRGSTYWFFVLE